jgi:hypothetical protein
MILRASTVGELAARVLARGGKGEVTRAFPNSLYIRSGSEFIVLLWGGLRSPLTVNMRGEQLSTRLVPGVSCKLNRTAIAFDGISVDLKGVGTYQGSLLQARSISLPTGARLRSSVAILRSLYEVSPEGPRLPTDRAFHEFVGAVAFPLAHGERLVVHDFGRYRALLGRGVGFTPAGDDFIGGFAAVYNVAARVRRWKAITFPARSLSTLTTPESGAILRYATMGYVDEVMERLMLRSMAGGKSSFHRELFASARRGHTSGVDMSLGVLLCEAALKEAEEGGDVLRRCLEVLWIP